MEDSLKIGLIVKPQGVKGELKVNPLTDDIGRFSDLKSVLIDGVSYKITHVKFGVGCVYLTLFGITDRNTAETFRNKFITVKREDSVKLKKDSFFIADLIGLTLCTEKGKVGEIIDITPNNTDYFTVKTVDKKTMMFPFLKDLNGKADYDEKTFTVNGERLKEISVYED